MYSLQEKYNLITQELLQKEGNDVIKIINEIMQKDFINIHGPEHHFLDGASFLVAYKNSGGSIDLVKALEELSNRTINMPGAMCGYWGVCGSITSVGASLSIINNVTPLTSNEFYKDNMEYTSEVINKMSKIGGPRCCKRNAFTALSSAVDFVNKKYNVEMKKSNIECAYSHLNKQCIGIKCPYFKEKNYESK